MKAERTSQISRTIAFLMAVCLVAPPAQAKYGGGTGKPDDPYRIATAADLIALGETPEDYNKHFILTADIDLDPNLPGCKVFDKAVIAPDNNPAEPGHQGHYFVGIFDGNGHTIKNLKVEGRLCSGLFGCLARCASVSHLRLEAIEVSGTRYVGGLVAASEGSVVDSYSSGSVHSTGSYDVGGLVGDNSGGSITSSFWDVWTSRQETSPGGTGKTTPRMQVAKTFLDAGWDFVGETVNGTEDIWWIDEDKDYPRLS